MKRRALGCLLFVLTIWLVWCQGKEVKQETPKDVAKNFVHTLFNVEYEDWSPKFEAYRVSSQEFYEEIKELTSEENKSEVEDLYEEQVQRVKELYSNLRAYMTPTAFEDSITKNNFLEARNTCFEYQANSKVISLEYHETVSDEQSAGYYMTVNYEISLINEDVKRETSQTLNVLLKKQEDNSWKITELIMGEMQPIVIDGK